MSDKTILDIDTFYDDVARNAYTRDEETGAWGTDLEYIEQAEQAFKENLDRLNSVGIIYSKADSIITGDKINVEVKVMPEVDTTSMNDGKTIIFNANLIEDVDDESIVSLHGFNYHEVAHVLYTPREQSDLVKYVIANKLKKSMNILEDARIERLLIAKYESVRPFLEASVLDYLLKGDPDEWANGFILTTGRMYLDYEIRQEIATRFASRYGIGLSEELHSIIHSYRQLIFPTDYDKAKELITRFGRILGLDDDPEPPAFAPKDGEGHADRDPQKKGRMDGAKEQQRLQDKAKGQEQGKDFENFDNVPDPADNPENNPLSPEELGEQREETEATKAMRNKVEELLKEIMRDDEVKRDTKEVTKAINNNELTRSAVKKATYSNFPIKTRVMASARAFATELERLRIDSDPAWDTMKSSGRLNITRAMKYDINDINTLFDEWNDGNSANDIEAVILTDTSGSMGWQIAQTLESAWIIKRAIERIQGRVSVYKFNHDSRLIYGADEKANPAHYRFVQSSGSTNPYKALVEAERILTASRKPIKMIFIITDGYWDWKERNDAIISRMNKTGIITSVAYLGELNAWKSDDPIEQAQYDEQHKANLIEYRHGATFFNTVTNPTHLVDIARDIVKSKMGKRH